MPLRLIVFPFNIFLLSTFPVYFCRNTQQMSTAIQYMVNEKGKTTSVLVPLKTWDKINQDYEQLQAKLRLLTGLKDALKEVKSSQKTGKPLQTLNEFLHESSR